MKKLILNCFILGLTAGCATNPNRVETVSTKLEKDQIVSGDQKIGIRDGNLVYQRKVLMSEELRSLQNEVYYLEDDVYGNDRTGNRGMYGVLKECKSKMARKENGGTGTLTFTEPRDLVTAHEETWTIGLDEKDRLVGISEEFLKDRITRFQGYRRTLLGRRDDIEMKRDICQLQMKNQQYDAQAKQ